jgi:RND family efflux transporter MFP subunit
MRFLKRLLVVFVIGALGSELFGQGGPPPANVVVDAVRAEELVERRVVTGEIRSRLSSALASQVEGLVVELQIEEGDVVSKGQVIARLDDVRAQIAVSRAIAEVDFAAAVMMQREAELDVARRDLSRLEELDRLGSSGVSQLDEARTLVASREALMAQAKAEMASAKNDLMLRDRELEDMTVVAPFAGRVVMKHSDVGQWVGRGDEIVTIVSLSELEARVDIPEDVYGAVLETKKAGGKIEISLPALNGRFGGRVYGEILAILPRADSLSRLFAVRIAVEAVDENGKSLLRPGMSLSAWVPTGKPGQFVTVSKDAIVRTATGEVVYYSDDGISAVTPVTRLFAVGDRVAVRSFALRDGMMVVVDGNERLFPGQGLIVQDAPNGEGVVGGKPAADGSD